MNTRVQLTRFCLVGTINFIVHLATFAVAINTLALTQLMSNAIAYLVASSFSFVMNSIWSFEVKLRVRRYARFQLVALLGLAVCAILGRLGDEFSLPYAVTVLATVLILPLISFLVHRRYTFREPGIFPPYREAGYLENLRLIKAARPTGKPDA
jgi:putative flippase GtrA